MLPGVTIQGNVSRETSDTDRPNSVQGTITARLEIPIYQGGAEYGQFARPGAARPAAYPRRLRAGRGAANRRQRLCPVRGAVAAISANKQQIRAATQALNGVIEERKVGQRTTLDVLDAQQSVLIAKESLASSQRNAVVASYSLLAAMGALTVTGQNLQVAEYRPEIHYEAVQDKWFGLRTVDGR